MGAEKEIEQGFIGALPNPMGFCVGGDCTGQVGSIWSLRAMLRLFPQIGPVRS